MIIVAAGIGLRDEGLGQPGTIDVTLPSGVTVKQVLIYWEGHNPTAVGDPNILVDGGAVTGVEIGGPNFFFGGAYSTTYRADITGDVTLAPGATTSVQVDGMDFEKNNGAGILVVFDDGSRAWDLGVKDGNDLAQTTLDFVKEGRHLFPRQVRLASRYPPHRSLTEGRHLLPRPPGLVGTIALAGQLLLR